MAEHQHTNIEWRAISHDMSYEISNTGNVRNTKHGRLLKPTPAGTGRHLRVDLPSGRYYVQKLVAEAFIGPCPEGHVATHRDRDVTNNHADNIIWATKSDISRAAWLRKQAGQSIEAFPIEGIGANG